MDLDPPDPKKEASNLRKHAISLGRFEEMDLTHALVTDVSRPEDGETRVAVTGEIDGKLWTGIVTYRGTRTRVISLRRANKKEERRYAKAEELRP